MDRTWTSDRRSTSSRSGRSDKKTRGKKDIVGARRQEKQVRPASVTDVNANRVWLDIDNCSEQNAHHAATPSTLSWRVGGPSNY